MTAPAPLVTVQPAPLPMAVTVGQASTPDKGNLVVLEIRSPQGVQVLFLDLKCAETTAQAMLKVVKMGHLTLAAPGVLHG